jgi:hypothetical protein
MMEERKYVVIDDVAKHYDVSTSTVRGWLRNKTIPVDAYIKVGHTYRFCIADVDAALRAHTRGETPASANAETEPNGPVQLEFDFDAFHPDKDI